MILTLDIASTKAAPPGVRGRKVFQSAGGNIGRRADNDWILDDPLVSRHHATIRYANGQFFVVDASTNGTFLNSRDNRLVRGQEYEIKAGDRILIEPYEIKASITADLAVEVADPFQSPDGTLPGERSIEGTGGQPFAAASKPLPAPDADDRTGVVDFDGSGLSSQRQPPPSVLPASQPAAPKQLKREPSG